MNCTAVTARNGKGDIEHCKEPATHRVSVIPTKYGYDKHGNPPPAMPRCLEHATRFVATTNRAVVEPPLEPV